MNRWLRLLHRLHRVLGAALCVLLLSWFASGAVMTFAGFPSYRAEARLHDSAPLPSTLDTLPPQVLSWLSSDSPQSGNVLTLVNTASGPRWSLQSSEHGVQSVAALPPHDSPAVGELSARAEAERIVRARTRAATLLSDPDQWTVPLPRTLFPLWKVELRDAESSVLYIVRGTGEVVQRTDRPKRLWAWLGAIPHWIYPTILRQQRALWKQVVIILASFSLVISVSGLIIGADAKLRLWRRRHRAGRTVLRDRYLRWHQRIGLCFGVFVSTWLFSGILSFTPFEWTRSAGVYKAAPHKLAGAKIVVDPRFIPDALARCQRDLVVHELRYLQIVGVPTVVCLARSGASRIVRQREGELHASARLPDTDLRLIATALGASSTIAGAHVLEHADAYYYPTHASPQIARPYWRIDLDDADETSYYFDPRLAELLQIQTCRLRWSRWLFQGLHSWDFAFLYESPLLWRSLVVLAMLLGSALSLTALRMAIVRFHRRRKREPGRKT